MRTMTHLISVSDSEHLVRAQQFADAEYPVDDATSFYLDQQEFMSSNLYVAPNKAKGSTSGRKRLSRERRH